ncbi:type IV pilin protein [Vibrio sp. M260118]|uniref:type IV pilin protein n=1 Tax=Vibrio sp. M260118 TaxID=3020896 RepID=UPI002F3E46B8
MKEKFSLEAMLAANKNRWDVSQEGLEMIRTSLCKIRENRVEGMTLIELLICVVIIGALCTIAYPSYHIHVLQSHRTTALANIAMVQLELEREYTTSYLVAADTVLTDGECDFCTLDSDRFEIAISATESTYTITATALGSQLKDRCNGALYSELSINQLGEMVPEDCWP